MIIIEIIIINEK